MMDNSVSSNGFPGSVAGSVPVVTNSTPLPATETVPRSSPRQRLLAALTGLLPRNLPASNRPSGGATSSSSYKGASRALGVTALLAVLAVGPAVPAARRTGLGAGRRRPHHVRGERDGAGGDVHGGGP